MCNSLLGFMHKQITTETNTCQFEKVQATRLKLSPNDKVVVCVKCHLFELSPSLKKSKMIHFNNRLLEPTFPHFNLAWRDNSAYFIISLSFLIIHPCIYLLTPHNNVKCTTSTLKIQFFFSQLIIFLSE